MQSFFLPFWIAIAGLSLALALLVSALAWTFRQMRLAKADLRRYRSEMALCDAASTQCKQEWQSLFDMTDEGIVIQQDGHIVAGNNAFAYMMGIESPDLIGADLLRMLVRDDRGVFIEAMELVRSGAETHKVQVRLRTLLGDLRQVVASVHKGNYNGKNCELIFISDSNKKAQDQTGTTSKEFQFATVIEEIESMVAIFGMHGVLQWGNAAWRSFWGVGSGMESGSYALFQDVNYATQELTDAASRAASGQSVRVSPTRMSSPKGHSRTLSMRFVPIFDSANSSTVQSGFALIQTDVTEDLKLKSEIENCNDNIEKVNARLREFVDKQNDIFDSLPGVFINVSILGIVTYWNSEAEARFDILRTHALGQPITILSPKFAGLDDKVRKVCADQKVLRLDFSDGEVALLCPCSNKRLAILRIFNKELWGESFVDKRKQ